MSAWMVTIAVDGTATAVELPADPDAQLKALQEAVGGYIERVSVALPATAVMWVNEEGRIHNLPHNLAATYMHHRGSIVGPAVITGDDDNPLSERDAKNIQRVITNMMAVQA